MVPSSSAAAALAVLPTRDEAPRVIQQSTSIFLISRFGELWRVYDTSAPDGTDRSVPSGRSTHLRRLFLALTRKTELRVHTFAAGDSREVDPVSLQRQLDASAAA